MQHLKCCEKQIKSVEAKSGCFEVLPGRWLETAHTRQYDEDLHPAAEKEELVFVCTRICLYNVWLCGRVLHVWMFYIPYIPHCVHASVRCVCPHHCPFPSGTSTPCHPPPCSNHSDLHTYNHWWLHTQKSTHTHILERKFKDNHLDVKKKIIASVKMMQFILCVYLTVHLVALHKGFIILQVCTRVPDVGPDIFIQVPGIITTVKICQILYNKCTAMFYNTTHSTVQCILTVMCTVCVCIMRPKMVILFHQTRKKTEKRNV